MTKTKTGKRKAKPMAKTARATKTKKNSKLPSRFRQKFGKPAIFVAVFALIGVGTLLFSYATVPTGEIVSKQSGECLENFFNRQIDGNFISTYPCNSDNEAQKWSVYSNDKSIRTAQNYCLDVQKGGKAPMTKVHLWRCTGGVPQKWDVLSNGTLRNPNSNLCLEAGSTDTFLGGPALYVNTCDANNARQVWKVPQAVIPTPIPPAPSNPPANDGNLGTVNGTAVRSHFPNKFKTGPRSAPKTNRGSFTISEPGAVIDGYNVNGTIVVAADNVTIRNTVVTTGSSFGIENRARDLVVEDTRIVGTNHRCAAGIGRGNYTLRRVDISGCADGAKLGGVVAIYDSYFHDVRKGPGTHNDTLQKNDKAALSKLIVRGNAMYAPACQSNRQIQLNASSGHTVDVVIENNFFYGMRGIMVDNMPITGRISGNVFAGSASKGPFEHGSLYGTSSGGVYRTTRTGNVFESGQPANDNPGGYTCVAG